jgi:hypothetical protein
VECRIDDLQALDRRLRSRQRTRSQVAGVFAAPTEGSGKQTSGEAYFRDVIANMKRPADGYLVVDTSQPLARYIGRVVDYIQRGDIG